MSQVERFFDFIYNSDAESTAELRRDLEGCGVDVTRLESDVLRIVSRAGRQHQSGWLERARENQKRFEERLKKKKATLTAAFGDSKALLDAIMSGELGPLAQSQARVFFRNGTEGKLSEKDLISLIEDCQLLEDDENGDEAL